VEIVPQFKTSKQVCEADDDFDSDKAMQDLDAMRKQIEEMNMSMVVHTVRADEYMGTTKRTRLYIVVIDMHPKAFKEAGLAQKFGAHMNVFRGAADPVEGCISYFMMFLFLVPNSPSRSYIIFHYVSFSLCGLRLEGSYTVFLVAVVGGDAYRLLQLRPGSFLPAVPWQCLYHIVFALSFAFSIASALLEHCIA
jgi:hypothetical protein